MPALTPAAVRTQIASGDTAPIYLLVGEDEREKAELLAAFANAIDEELRAFNVERVYARDLTTGERLAGGVASLVEAVQTVPLLAPRRVVIVLQAEAMLAPKRESEAASRALERLEALIASPVRETTLVFAASGPIDRRSRIYKLLAREATLVDCGSIESEGDAERWIRNRVAAAGTAIAPAAARLLAQRAGTDLRRLRGDVERLLLYAMGQATIGVEDATQIAGMATLQHDWAMANAIESGQTAEALRQLALMLDAGEAPEKILGQVGWLVRSKFPQIAPGRLRNAVDALFRTDLDLKRSAGDPRVLLERLVVELTGGRAAPSVRR